MFNQLTRTFEGENKEISVFNLEGVRIAPQGLFNEADFWKCFAQLVLHIQNKKLPGLVFIEDQFAEHGIEFIQDGSSGDLHLANYLFLLADDSDICLGLNINSRDPSPMYFWDEKFNKHPCLDAEGDVSAELTQFLKRKNDVRPALSTILLTSSFAR